MSGWGSFATYACEIAPAITAKCKHWYSNDFDGLNGEDSILLADRIQQEIDSGRTEKYARLRHSGRGMTLSEFIRLCGGPGLTPEREAAIRAIAPLVCDTWDGDDYHLRWVKRLQEFVNFLRHCGGFQIG
jgi:hypothetical protein